MESILATYIRMTDPLRATLKQTIETITDFIDDVAIIVWLVDQTHQCLIVKSQLNAGSGLEDSFKLDLDANDFVTRAFRKNESIYGDDLLEVIEPDSKEFAQSRR